MYERAIIFIAVTALSFFAFRMADAIRKRRGSKETERQEVEKKP